MEGVLEGRITKGVHILPADCGLGKGEMAKGFLKECSSKSHTGKASILICLPTLEEIDKYLEAIEPSTSSYAVFVGDTKYHGYGLGRHKAGSARMLFTTHSMFMLRVFERKAFADVDCFHYDGQRRSFILWDEGLTPVPHASFRLNSLYALPNALEGSSPELAELIADMLPDISARIENGVVRVPAAIGELATPVLFKMPAGSRIKGALEGLQKLAGTNAYLRQDNYAGWQLIGAGRPLPADLPPTLVMDASARLTTHYDAWGQLHGVRVVNLPPAQSEYSQVEIAIWERGCGKQALKSNADRLEIFRVIAALINDHPSESWLIVHAKSARLQGEKEGELPRDLAALINEPDRVKSLHWGLHFGTNDHRDVRNVIILGDHSYGSGDYRAMAMARHGLDAANITDEQVASMRDEQLAHDYFQAICRSNVRNHVAGVAGNAKVYVAMPDYARGHRALSKAFPGASIERWEPVTGKPPSNFELIKAAILTLLSTQEEVSLKQVREACGRGADKHFLKHTLKSPEYAAFLAEHGIERRKNKLRYC